MERKRTTSTREFGTSIPTKERPGTGATIRKRCAERAKDKSFCREAICATRTFMRCSSSPLLPLSIKPGSTANCVIAGPTRKPITFAGMPNSAKVFSINPAIWLMVRSSKRTFRSSISISKGGKTASRWMGFAGRSSFSSDIESDFRYSGGRGGDFFLLLRFGSFTGVSSASSTSTETVSSTTSSPAARRSHFSTYCQRLNPPMMRKIHARAATTTLATGPRMVSRK